MSIQVIGLDPGVTTGIFVLSIIDNGYDVAQCSAIQIKGDGVLIVIDAWAAMGVQPTQLAVESFVPSPRSSRVGNTKDIKATKDIIAQIQTMGLSVAMRPAVTVKAWATDARLEAAGLLDATHQMRHARDASRHALYAAVMAGHLQDPLSRKGKSS